MRRSIRAIAATGASLVAALALAGCGGSSGGSAASGGGSGSSSANALHGSVNVLAAASLTEAFTTLGKQFERAHPGVKVVLDFGPSSGLAEQIAQGAPADVFASASTKNMDQVVSAGDARNPTAFVRNVMEVAVPPGNPARVTSVRDLARPGVKVALCQPQVPCGATAAKVFANGNLTVRPVTQEVDVKSVLSKVELGEVDAGVVYVTDVRAAGAKVKGIPIAPDVNASTTYPIAALAKAPNQPAAAAFVRYVLSAAGQRVLTADGFEKP
jgi:molybdate transport system substrate-binding protein